MSSNFRRYLLSLSLLVGAAAPFGAAHAQASISSVGSGSVEDRVTQLERISNAHSQLLTQLQQQLSANQSDIDTLRGQIQERQRQILLQIDSLSGEGAGTQSSSTQTNSAPAAAATGGTAGVGQAVQGGDANSDYNAAFALVQDKARQDDAIKAFQSFVQKYPDSTYQPNANYWLGQLSYNKGDKDGAAHYFATVVKSWPKSPKAPDAMYKVGVIMQDKGDSAKAKAVYQQVVTKYPGTEAAKQAQKKIDAK